MMKCKQCNKTIERNDWESVSDLKRRRFCDNTCKGLYFHPKTNILTITEKQHGYYLKRKHAKAEQENKV